jgi:hypothetical protein
VWRPRVLATATAKTCWRLLTPCSRPFFELSRRLHLTSLEQLPRPNSTPNNRQSSTLEISSTWTGPNALTGPGVGQPGQPMATARQTDNQIDVFFVDGNGVVNVMWVVDVGVWQGPVGLTPPGTAVPNSPLATARQTDNQIDIFFVDGRGVVKVGAWQGPGGLTPQGTAGRGAPIATARQTGNQIDLFLSTAMAS